MSRHVHKASTQIGTGALPPNWAPINFSTNISSLIGSLPIGFHSTKCQMSDEIIVAKAFCILHFNVKSGVGGKGFLAPGKGKGNWKSHSRFTGRERELENATGREGNGKFEARNPGNPGKSRESHKKQGQIQDLIYFHALTSHPQNCK